jgi:hypothetical protein
VQIAHQLGVGLGEFPERAVQELDAGGIGGTGRLGLERGFEPELAELRFERTDAARAARAPPGLAPPVVPDAGRVGRIGADVLGEGGGVDAARELAQLGIDVKTVRRYARASNWKVTT